MTSSTRSTLATSTSSQTTQGQATTAAHTFELDTTPWTDKQIVEELLKRYRFPGETNSLVPAHSPLDATANISIAVFLAVERVLSSDDLQEGASQVGGDCLMRGRA